MLTRQFALTVGNLERLAGLTPRLAAAGCLTRLILAGVVIELRIDGTDEALDRAVWLLCREPILSNMDGLILPRSAWC